MHLLTVLGTRPEIIRLSVLLHDLKQAKIQNTVVFTNQNATDSLSTVFIDELGVEVDYYVPKLTPSTSGEWIGHLFKEIDRIIQQEKPDVFLVLGDTHSALSAIIAGHYNLPIIHMEAGNRSFDMRMPEEKNRKIIDHISTYLLPYTEMSKHNLISEGISEENIYVFGNPITDVLKANDLKINGSTILERLGIKEKEYLLVTLHRSENVDNISILNNILNGLNLVAQHFDMPVIWGVHPRTQSKLKNTLVKLDDRIKLSEPFDFFDFVKLEKNAFLVLTDSGTVQEECSILMTPVATIRETTERPETIECGSNMLSGTKDPARILEVSKIMSSSSRNWISPYKNNENISKKIINFLTWKF